MTYQQAYQIIAAKLPLDDPAIERRLERAYSMLIGYGYDFTVYNKGLHTQYWLVDKLSTMPAYAEGSEPTQYKVDDIACTCPDFTSGTVRGGLCKHRIAVMMLEEMGEY